MEKYFLGYNKTEGFFTKLRKLLLELRLKELARRGIIFTKERIIREKIQYFLFKLFNRNNQFTFNNKTYRYLHTSKTFFNERMIEIPLFTEILKKNKGKRILEIGHVMHNFVPIKHDVVDKYEVGKGVINEDVTTFSTKKKYDLIISVSTIEHVGWDEQPRQPTKILAAIKNLQKLTKKGGEIIYSIPWDYNQDLDELLKKEKLPHTNMYFLVRNKNGSWKQTNQETLRKVTFNHHVPSANGVIIVHLKS